MSSEWFYRSAGRDFGPVPFDRLQFLASEKQLMPADEIRRGGSSEWIEAGKFPHLFENATPAAADNSVPGLTDVSLDEFQIVSENEESRLVTLEDVGIQVSDEPTAPPAKSAAEGSEDQWICRVLGVQLGPMPEGDLMLLAKKGEISLDDEVRRANETEWRPAKTVDRLFPGFEYHSDDGISAADPLIVGDSSKLPEIGDDINSAILGLPGVEVTDSPEKAPPAEKSVAVKTKRRKKSPGSPAAKPKKNKRDAMEEWLSDAVPQPEPPTPPTEEPSHSEPAEPPSAASTPPVDRAAQLRAEYEARTVRVSTHSPAPAAKQKRAKSSSSGSSSLSSGLMEKIKENPKNFGVFAVLAIVLIVKYVPTSFGLGDHAYLNQITEYTNKYKELRERKASKAEMEQFKKEALAVIKPLGDELEKAGAGISDRPKQEMLWACRKFEELLGVEESDSAAEVERTLNGHLRDAQAMIR